MASTIPVPIAANPTLLPAPTVNATPWNFVSNTVIASAQVNSNFYALWNYLLQLVTYLNATYIPANGVGSVVGGPGIGVVTSGPGEGGATVSLANTGLLGITAASPLSVSGGQNPTLSLTHGDYVDTNSTQAGINGAKTFLQPITQLGSATLNPGFTGWSNTTKMGIFVGNSAYLSRSLFVYDALTSTPSVTFADTSNALKVNFSGATYAPAFNVTCARSLKEEIAPFPTSALAIAHQTRLMTFRRKPPAALPNAPPDPDRTGDKVPTIPKPMPWQAGIIADDAHPMLKAEGFGEEPAVDVYAIACVALAAVAELSAKVDALAARIR